MSRPDQVPAFGPGLQAPSLPDVVAVAQLPRVLPPALVDDVLAETGREGQRNRLLPPRVVVYLVLTMCLLPDTGYEDAARLVIDALAWVRDAPLGALAPRALADAGRAYPTTAAITRARAKLGPEPLRRLYEHVAERFAPCIPDVPCPRVHTLDCVDLPAPASEPNLAHFRSPEVRVEVLATGASIAPLYAEAGPRGAVSTVMNRRIAGVVGAGDVVIVPSAERADALWSLVRGRDVHLLWPAAEPPTDAPDLRVVRHERPGVHPALVTTMPEPLAIPAPVLATHYVQRRTLDAYFAAITPGGRNGSRVPVLRSRVPESAEQEAWACLLAPLLLRAAVGDEAAMRQSELPARRTPVR